MKCILCHNAEATLPENAVDSNNPSGLPAELRKLAPNLAALLDVEALLNGIPENAIETCKCNEPRTADGDNCLTCGKPL